MKLKRYILPAIMMSVLMIVTSCGSGRRNVAGEPVSSKMEQRVVDIIDSYGQWHDFSVPVKVQLRKPLNISLSGKAVFVKDSLVNISLRFFGIEVAVMHATPDSLFCVDKFHHIAVRESIKHLSSKYGVTLGDIQALMIGRVFMPGGDITKARVGKEISLAPGHDSTYDFLVSGNKSEIACLYKLLPDMRAVQSVDISLKGRAPVTGVYSGWKETEIGLFPSAISTEFAIGKRSVDASLAFTPSSIKVNQGKIPAFKCPADCKIVSVEQLMKIKI